MIVNDLAGATPEHIAHMNVQQNQQMQQGVQQAMQAIGEALKAA